MSCANEASGLPCSASSSTVSVAVRCGIGTRNTFSNERLTLVASSVPSHSWKSVENDVR